MFRADAERDPLGAGDVRDPPQAWTQRGAGQDGCRLRAQHTQRHEDSENGNTWANKEFPGPGSEGGAR